MLVIVRLVGISSAQHNLGMLLMIVLLLTARVMAEHELFLWERGTRLNVIGAFLLHDVLLRAAVLDIRLRGPGCRGYRLVDIVVIVRCRQTHVMVSKKTLAVRDILVSLGGWWYYGAKMMILLLLFLIYWTQRDITLKKITYVDIVDIPSLDCIWSMCCCCGWWFCTAELP